jgi:hypothetical protein
LQSRQSLNDPNAEPVPSAGKRMSDADLRAYLNSIGVPDEQLQRLVNPKPRSERGEESEESEEGNKGEGAEGMEEGEESKKDEKPEGREEGEIED